MNYLFGKSRMRLFELTLISAALILAVSIIKGAVNFAPKANLESFTLKSGWTSWVTDETNRYQQASDVCMYSPDPNFKVLQVSREAYGGWNTYYCDQAENDFPIVTGTVYHLFSAPASN